MEFKINIALKDGKSYKCILKEPDAAKLVGLKVGDSFTGSIIGANDYEFKITGGSDNAGFPMRKDIGGVRRVKILTGKSVGLKTIKAKGWRRRKTMRGNTISEDVAQLNVIPTKMGSKKLEELFPKAAGEEKKEEAPRPKKEKEEEKPKKEEAPKPKEEKPKSTGQGPGTPRQESKAKEEKK